MKYLFLLAFAFVSTSLFAQVQTYPNIDQSLTDWGVCDQAQNPECNPGGTVAPTQVIQQIVTSPCLDSKCMEFSATGPGGKDDYTDVLWYYKPGPWSTDAAAYFKHTFEVYVSATSNAQAFEFDLFKFDSTVSPGVEYMFGSQCAIGGEWQVWNYQLSNPWVNTGITCNQLTPGKYHSIAVYDHLVAGDNSCSSRPCMFYDYLVIDGTSYTLDLTEPAEPLPSGWTSNMGVQYQLDINQSGGTLTEYVDEDNFKVCSASDASDCEK
jgi:hypothetical protein